LLSRNSARVLHLCVIYAKVAKAWVGSYDRC